MVLLDLKSSILREVSACLRGTKAVLFRPAKFLLEALFARDDNVTLSPLLLQWKGTEGYVIVSTCLHALYYLVVETMKIKKLLSWIVIFIIILDVSDFYAYCVNNILGI